MKRQGDFLQTNRWEKLFGFLYALFFVAQIFSPSINERTIYLEWFIMLLNPYFWRWLMPIKLTYKRWGIVLLLLFIVALGHPITALKIILNLYSGLALVYFWQKRIWYINIILCVSIIVAVLQLVFMYVNVEIAYMLGPRNLSSILWGSYATQTNTNLYDALGIGIPRASGLSREAGFLASLIVVVIMHRIIDMRGRKEAGMNFMCALGYIASFSKMSFIIIMAFGIIKIRKFIDKVYMPIWIVVFLLGMLLVWSRETNWLNEAANITFLSRFGGYDAMWYLDTYQFFFGEEYLDKVGGVSAINEYYGENGFAGLGGWIINNGILTFGAFVLILWLLDFSSTGVILLILFTINVQPDTNQNFVVYAWFLCLEYFQLRNNTPIIGEKAIFKSKHC